MVDEGPGVRDAERRMDALFSDHYSDLYRYAVRRCDSAEDAEDLVAEVFLVAWRRMDDLPDGNEARLWLFGTARLLRSNQRRGHGRRQRLLHKLRVGRRPPASGLPHADTFAPEVHEALTSLDAADREVLLLAAWEELPAPEIAVVLEITPAAARKRLERARRRFREALAAPPRTVSTMTVEEAGR